MRYAIFHGTFEIGGGGGIIFMNKKMHFALNVNIKKQRTFRYVFIYKNTDTLCHIFIRKKQCTLRYIFIPRIYRIVYSDT